MINLEGGIASQDVATVRPVLEGGSMDKFYPNSERGLTAGVDSDDEGAEGRQAAQDEMNAEEAEDGSAEGSAEEEEDEELKSFTNTIPGYVVRCKLLEPLVKLVVNTLNPVADTLAWSKELAAAAAGNSVPIDLSAIDRSCRASVTKREPAVVDLGIDGCLSNLRSHSAASLSGSESETCVVSESDRRSAGIECWGTYSTAKTMDESAVGQIWASVEYDDVTVYIYSAALYSTTPPLSSSNHHLPPASSHSTPSGSSQHRARPHLQCSPRSHCTYIDIDRPPERFPLAALTRILAYPGPQR
ncbi:hypothetical protein FB451DRAFT_1492048 [Mycena latifolia]|nr:hypothetical protein FB451DRAFT_1492048 [Mycena latifolia]